ncbi:hypothetical protein HK099_005630 [Clydaea vesicula]|uniref:tRNA-5-taurinomethyluridine 2-sulfurtransferase n=1 Tax=Clydaea vesicula TaxID=447962 RepID=A0AAD5U283_9FUNG|nr:hypothetical protein HK099_005630 [Clydaea vesicula]
MSRVALALSGGIDSMMSAYLLSKQGYKVTGVYMNSWDFVEEKGYCTGERDYNHASKICDLLNIDFKRVDYVKEYWNLVFTDFLENLRKGKTPNPDVGCNQHIKFGSFFNDFIMKNVEYDYIATGHYASLMYKDEKHILKRAYDKTKDQSYYLSTINSKIFKYTLFPLANIRKQDLKEELIKNKELRTRFDFLLQKKESTGICFIGERKNFKRFLDHYVEKTNSIGVGKFVSVTDGRVISNFKNGGLEFFLTIGQSAKIPGESFRYKMTVVRQMLNKNIERWYVVEKSFANNIILVAPNNHNSLFKKRIRVHNFFWQQLEIDNTSSILDNAFVDCDNNIIFNCHVKYRYRMEPVECKVLVKNTKFRSLLLEFATSQKGVALGQHLTLYLDDEVLGGGEISYIENCFFDDKEEG